MFSDSYRKHSCWWRSPHGTHQQTERPRLRDSADEWQYRVLSPGSEACDSSLHPVLPSWWSGGQLQRRPNGRQVHEKMLSVTDDRGQAYPNPEITPPSPQHGHSTKWEISSGGEDVGHGRPIHATGARRPCPVPTAVTPEGCRGAPPHVCFRVTAPYASPDTQPREMKTRSHKH